MIRNVTVYSSIATNLPPDYYVAAAELGAAFAKAGIHLIYGGTNRGLMASTADAVLSGGGTVTGVFPAAESLQAMRHDKLTELIETIHVHERKMIMYERADAFVVLPGGYGTVDEVFEVLTLRKLKLHEKHVYFFNYAGYWQPMMQMLAHFVSMRTMNPSHLEFFTFVQTVPELMSFLRPQE
ncbi:MAG: TIGR00730 family Rossman fold protein [Bdellovibrionales bacterium]